MYELNNANPIVITAMGEELRHYPKKLSAEDWLKYQRDLATAGNGTDKLAGEQWIVIYDAKIERVEGYSLDGADLMTAKPEDWRDYIPGDHKASVAWELIRGPELKKKSETRSGSSATPKSVVQGGKNAATT